MNKIKILIVDDSFKFIKSAVNFISLSDEFEIVGGAMTGQTALEMIKHHKPDLVLLDLVLPDISGIELIAKIKKIDKNIRVIIVTFKENKEYKELSIKSGADGFINKSDFGIQLIPLIHQLFAPIRRCSSF
jgi:DNA-binding NarL/FixJ family response regulator